MTEQEIESAIAEMFEQNYELLQAEGGHSLTQDTKRAALQQVLLYWRKMRDVAERVTETEVKLTLPEQQTPKGRKYSIHGVVDIVQEDERTVMYDIKTHDAEYVESNISDYEKQLNIYAHIWQNLRGHPLDQTAIIATAYPKEVKQALNAEDDVALEAALDQWEPLVNIPFDQQHVDDVISDFGDVVDAIEDRQFTPPSATHLGRQYKTKGRERRFATQICSNCDGRFSCSSYRAYTQSNRGSDASFNRYFREFDSTDQEEWLSANLEADLEA
ncbi:PD-(D/E)XK nuclease family protein [Nodosilinea sp. FACHB-131]|uniref:PD-(D/E)XK nuclease family protein n=1 Tax=Cyanophyceae TaxID=3028117 RepID=UPI001687D1F3|nr:PD-(D/E)XK nuclease family protein [Nodosilinea sp. FACHB-131]MBD1877009.1 PD-(D/E)XK nuclease family protein [Nodosilinea sp. FACHB-131]